MNSQQFDYNIRDSQATTVVPVSPAEFDYCAYEDYEQRCREPCRAFNSTKQGILIHRRMRAPDVFSFTCKDMRESLHQQLGALAASMKYRMDILNFLEPWYGIGVCQSSFGARYVWEQGQAPAVRYCFKNVEEALRYEDIPVRDTSIGKHVLEMIEFFLGATNGRLPISLTDTQSPLNIACGIVDINQLFLDMVVAPDQVTELLMRISDRLIEFTQDQLDVIGDNIVWPGHGFASSRDFEGLGMSDDNILMVSNDMYREVVMPSLFRLSGFFKGIAFHSCGDWSRCIPLVKEMPEIRVVDGAFTPQTDPTPNKSADFTREFADTGITVNARMVGDVEPVTDVTEGLWAPGTKLVVVTTCSSPEEQDRVYDRVQNLLSTHPRDFYPK